MDNNGLKILNEIVEGIISSECAEDIIYNSIKKIIEEYSFYDGMFFCKEELDIYIPDNEKLNKVHNFNKLLDFDLDSIRFKSQKDSKNIIVQSIVSKKVVTTENIPALFKDFTPQEFPKNDILKLGLKSAISIPIIYKKLVIGALFFIQSNDKFENIDLLKVISNLLALSIVNERLMGETVRKERDMLDILGHELRTPLTIGRNAVLSLKQFKISGQLSDELLHTYLKIAEDNLAREVRLLETMLSTTKIDNDSLKLVNTKVNLTEVINDSIEAFKPKSTDKGLDIELQLENNLFVYGDRVRVQEIVDNLIDNAIKYTDNGKIIIRTYKNKENIFCSVEDTGSGISEKDIPHLGKKFYRVKTYLQSSLESGTKIVRPGGTGLGLYVTYGLVKSMKGKIKVESLVNQGSKFIFYLPEYNGQPIEEGVSKKETIFERYERIKKELKEKKAK